MSVTILSISGFMGCTSYVSSIPDRPVSIVRYIHLFGDLMNLGGSLAISAKVHEADRIGFGGVLIVHGQDDNYYAVDMACPHEVDSNIKINYSSDSGIAKCPTCGEEYDLTFGLGTPTKRISKESLKHYKVSFNGSDEIIITP